MKNLVKESLINEAKKEGVERGIPFKRVKANKGVYRLSISKGGKLEIRNTYGGGFVLINKEDVEALFDEIKDFLDIPGVWYETPPDVPPDGAWASEYTNERPREMGQ